MLCYADDVAIFFHGVNKLRSIINNLEEWTQKNGMIVNKSKSGIMYIRKKDNEAMRKAYKSEKFNDYPIVQYYKFLGITLGPNFDLSQHFKNLKMKIKYVSYKALTLPRKVITPFHSTILWTLLIKSNVLYGVLMINYLTREMDKSDWIKIFRKSLKIFLKIENVSNDILDTIINAEEIMEEARYRMELAKYKWNEFLRAGANHKMEPINAPIKPDDPHLKVTQKMKYMNWNSLRIINITKFNLK